MKPLSWVVMMCFSPTETVPAATTIFTLNAQHEPDKSLRRLDEQTREPYIYQRL